MKLKEGTICKHFKGKDLIEKNIYKIIAFKPDNNGEIVFTHDTVVMYKSVFQDGKCFVCKYEDFIAELGEEEKKYYGQAHQVEPLSEQELKEISEPEFIKEKLEYLEQVRIKAEAERLAKEEMRKKEILDHLKQTEENNLEQIEENKKQL